MLKGETIVAHH